MFRKRVFFSCFIFLLIVSVNSYAEWSWYALKGPAEHGSVHCMRIHPKDPKIVFFGTDNTGILRSVDGGMSWTAANKGITGSKPYKDQVHVSSIAFDRVNLQNVYCYIRGIGVFKSIDLGLNWKLLQSFTGYRAYIDTDPDKGGVVYVMEDYQYYSADRMSAKFYIINDDRKTFKGKLPNEDLPAVKSRGHFPWARLLVDPSNLPSKRAFYYCRPSGIYRSEDNGVTWRRITQKLPPTVFQDMDIFYDKATDEKILFAACNTQSMKDGTWERGGIFKTTDEGKIWACITATIFKDTSTELQKDPAGMGGAWKRTEYRGVRVNHRNKNIIYVGFCIYAGRRIFKTTDGGKTWKNITRMVETDGNVNVTYLYQEEGDFGSSGIQTMDMAPSNPDRLYFRSHMMGVQRTTNGGKTWDNVGVYPDKIKGYWSGRGCCLSWGEGIAIDPKRPERMYVGYSDMGFFVSHDGGISFKHAYPRPMSKTFPSIRWITDGKQILRWKENSEFRKLCKKMRFAAHMWTITIDSQNTDLVYFGDGTGDRRSKKRSIPFAGRVGRTIDGGHTFDIAFPKWNGLPVDAFSSIVIDPSSPVDKRTVYVAARQHGVYKSIDGGVNWVFSGKGLPEEGTCSLLAISPSNPHILYAGLGVGTRAAHFDKKDFLGGLFISRDNGQTWEQLIEASLDVTGLLIDHKSPKILYMSTFYHRSDEKHKFWLPGVYKSTDGGENWKRVFDQPCVSGLCIHPHNPELLCAVVPEYAMERGRYRNALNELPDIDHIYRPGVYLSKNAGITWENITGNLSDHIMNFSGPCCFHPQTKPKVYIGTRGGFYMGEDKGSGKDKNAFR